MQLQIHECCNNTIFWIFKPSTTVSGQPCPEGPKRWRNSTLLTEMYGGNREESTLIAFLLQDPQSSPGTGSAWATRMELRWQSSSAERSPWHAWAHIFFLRCCLKTTKSSTDRLLRSYVMLFSFWHAIWLSLTLSHHLQSSSISVTSEYQQEH